MGDSVLHLAPRGIYVSKSSLFASRSAPPPLPPFEHDWKGRQRDLARPGDLRARDAHPRAGVFTGNARGPTSPDQETRPPQRSGRRHSRVYCVVSEGVE